MAGIGALAPALQVAVAWTPYFAVEDADVTASRIRERGATVAVGPVALHTGRGALAADRDGAVFGLWQGPLVSQWEMWRDTAPAWTRLQTRDAFDAAIFYGEVLDWACERPGCCDVRYEHEEVVLRHGGHVVARLTSGAVEAAPDPSLRPHWHTHFTVEGPPWPRRARPAITARPSSPRASRPPAPGSASATPTAPPSPSAPPAEPRRTPTRVVLRRGGPAAGCVASGARRGTMPGRPRDPAMWRWRRCAVCSD